MSRASSEPSERLLRILGEARSDHDDLRDPPREEPSLITIPRHLRQGRVDVRGRAVVGFAVVVMVALAVLGVRFVVAERHSQPVPVSSDPVMQAGDRAAFTSPSPGGSTQATATPPPAS
ncbi:hypothetical protein, partial [Janibacter sp. GXQ6167]|uniref:hypothetical protein n=1 Tax=Janibacter sp. GXQ6167 TaxID=3240791 RepID=UPI003526824E